MWNGIGSVRKKYLKTVFYPAERLVRTSAMPVEKVWGEVRQVPAGKITHAPLPLKTGETRTQSPPVFSIAAREGQAATNAIGPEAGKGGRNECKHVPWGTH
ncbi:hypothetical protein SAMN05428936_11437 [Pelagibacterium halotolerans]|nr:hypothetical protein SAMN05428936_11437 [Pelagibacterium halotolerans]